MGVKKPVTLIRALERKSKYLRQNVTIVEFLRANGFTDKEIFEHNKKLSVKAL